MIEDQKIVICDSGPQMEGNDENSISKCYAVSMYLKNAHETYYRLLVNSWDIFYWVFFLRRNNFHISIYVMLNLTKKQGMVVLTSGALLFSL